MNRKVILVPIARTRPIQPGNGNQIEPVNNIQRQPDSRRDYEEQQHRSFLGETWMWNDTPSNRTIVGDVFGFVYNNSHVNYHIVTEVHPAVNRLPEWPEHIGQRNRQVLYLSNEIGTHTWGAWIEAGGYTVNRTMYVENRELKDCLLYLF
jgi:hypothetical protein